MQVLKIKIKIQIQKKELFYQNKPLLPNATEPKRGSYKKRGNNNDMNNIVFVRNFLFRESSLIDTISTQYCKTKKKKMCKKVVHFNFRLMQKR